MLKRWMDLAIATACLVVAAPLLLLIAIAIKLDSSGPILHVQRRAGRNGQPFDFYKFRSMTTGHDHTQEHRRFAESYINNGQASQLEDHEGQALYKPASNGQTITRVGRWLRQTSLDELPQLFNVIKGDMSIVGPRPPMDYELDWYTERHRQRLTVLPGLTGWAQINGRSSISFNTIVDFDLEYIAQRSVGKDLSIILATIPMVLRGEHSG